MKITMFYDGNCIFCKTNAEKFHHARPDLVTIRTVSEGYQTLSRFGISLTEAMTYVYVQDEEDNMHRGMDAVRLLYQTAGFKSAPLFSLPLIKPFSNWLYPIIARNRYRFPRWLIRLIYGRVATLMPCNDVCHIAPKNRQG